MVRRAEYLDAAAIDVAEIQQALQQRGFAGAVDADQAEEFAALHLERHVTQGRRAAIVLDDTCKAQGKFRHGKRDPDGGIAVSYNIRCTGSRARASACRDTRCDDARGAAHSRTTGTAFFAPGAAPER